MAAVCNGLARQTDDCTFSISTSVVEIYCEKIRDLLDTSNENLQVPKSVLSITNKTSCPLDIAIAENIPKMHETLC